MRRSACGRAAWSFVERLHRPELAMCLSRDAALELVAAVRIQSGDLPAAASLFQRNLSSQKSWKSSTLDLATCYPTMSSYRQVILAT